MSIFLGAAAKMSLTCHNLGSALIGTSNRSRGHKVLIVLLDSAANAMVPPGLRSEDHAQQEGPVGDQ